MPISNPNDITIRTARPSDHSAIIDVMEDWWNGRDLRGSVPRLFLDHFHDTSVVAERPDQLIGFLIGFLSPAKPNEGYIHFAGVHPDYRKKGIAKELYHRFFRICTESGRTIVRSCTSPINKRSIIFHTKMGFKILKGNAEIDGIPVTLDYNRPNDPKVLFELRLF